MKKRFWLCFFLNACTVLGFIVDQLEIDIKKGKRAEQKLTDPLFVEAVERITAQYMETFIKSKPHEAQVRENAYFQLKAVEALQEELRKIMDNGRFAQKEIDRGNK